MNAVQSQTNHTLKQLLLLLFIIILRLYFKIFVRLSKIMYINFPTSYVTPICRLTVSRCRMHSCTRIQILLSSLTMVCLALLPNKIIDERSTLEERLREEASIVNSHLWRSNFGFFELGGILIQYGIWRVCRCTTVEVHVGEICHWRLHKRASMIFFYGMRLQWGHLILNSKTLQN